MVLPMYASAVPQPRSKKTRSLRNTWRSWKSSIMRAGQTIKSKAYKHRYQIAYALLLATISIIAIRQAHSVQSLKGLVKKLGQEANSLQGRLKSNEEMLKMAQDGVQSMTAADLRAVRGALANEDVTSYLAALSRSPKKLAQMNVLGLAKDLCQLEKGLCNKGILPRAKMPQVNLGQLSNIRKSLASYYSIGNAAVNVNAASIQPLQTELLTAKVVGMAGAMLNGKLDSAGAPLLIAEIGNEMFVVNGHHRWAAARIAKKPLKAHVVKYHGNPFDVITRPSRRHVLNLIRRGPGVTFAALENASKIPRKA